MSAYPSIHQCLKMMDEYAMLPNIREHSFVVGRVAETILTRLCGDTPPHVLPDKELVTAGALLHDIAKTKCLEENCDHAKVGAEICKHHGYPEVAEIVLEHVFLQHFAQDKYQKGIFQAKELIFYSDKRVVHDEIVTLSERLDYILQRYGNNDPVRHQIIQRNFEKCKNFENFLCNYTQCNPVELLKDISLKPY